jgi:hypothetical protein
MTCRTHLVLAAVLLSLIAAHVVLTARTEPFFNNDETRHVMTGVFFRDFYLDLPVTHVKDYTVRYYLQYPALGLLVWPPLFYAVEGAFMLLFGTSFLVARVLLGLFALLACVYLFRLALRTHDLFTAAVATLLFGFAPLVFTFSRQVMLEVPTLACALGAIYHLVRYLDDPRRRDLWLCCLFTAGTALMRFDGIFLAPLFLLLLVMKRRLYLLLRCEVLAAAVVAVLLVAPCYAVTAHEFGQAHLKAVKEGTMGDAAGFLALSNFAYYPAQVPGQIGWFAVAPALLGLSASGLPSRRASSWPYLAMIAATYLTFTPMAELESRHAIYWVPALAVFAADGIALAATLLSEAGARGAPLRLALAGGVVLGTAWLTCKEPAPFVRGYEEAACYVVANTHETPTCLFDSLLHGNFIYHVRRHDPDRRLWVLRGDKVFYSVLSDPHAEYKEYAKDKDDILALIHKYDPEFIVVEQPQVHFFLPMAEALREVLREHPERFRLEKTVPLDTNYNIFAGVRLEVYRNLVRNPDPDANLEIDMLGLRHSIQAVVPK